MISLIFSFVTMLRLSIFEIGAEVTVASVMKDELTCKMSRGIKVSSSLRLLLTHAVNQDV